MKQWLIALAYAWVGVSLAMGQTTLPTSYSGPWASTNLPGGWSINGLASDYAMNFDGTGGTAGKIDSSGDSIQIFFNGEPNAVSYYLSGMALSGEYVFKVQESVDGSNWSDVVTFNSSNPLINGTPVQYTNILLSTSRYVQFIYVTKAGGNIGFDGIQIMGLGLPSVMFAPVGDQSVPVSNELTLAVSIAPSVSGMHSWSLEPGSSGSASLADNVFTFTPASDDNGKVFTLLVVATNLIGTSTGTVQISVTPYEPPVPLVAFSPAAPYSIMATQTQELGIAVAPVGTGIESWTLLPSNYAGTAILVGTHFTFTPAATDGPGNYTLTVIATNGFGASTGTASIAVTQYIPPLPAGSYICTFEDGSKAGYTSGDVTLSNKVWNLTGILIGTTGDDLKIGSKAAHLKYNPSDGEENMTIQTPVMSNGVGTISLWYGPYGTHGAAAPTMAIEISENLASGWVEVGEVNAGAVTALTYYSADVYVSWPIYVRIHAKTGTIDRVANFDNVTITPYPEDWPPVITFSPLAPFSIMATATQKVGIGVTPAGGGIQSWTLLPSNYSGSAALVDTNFTFTPAQMDGPGNYTLSVIATNSSGSTTGTAAIAVLARYAITVAPPTNGAVATIPAGASTAGATVAITTTPAVGYAQGVITVVDSEQNPVTVTGNTFIMPASSVLVAVTFVPSHAITVVPATNGTLTTTPAETAGEGTAVSITATPNVGFMLEAFTVVDASSNPVAVTNSTFTMPTSAVTVAATFSLIPIISDTNAVRYEDFNAWSDPSFALMGNHSRYGWSIQNASIAPTSGVLNTRAALLTQLNSAIVSPAFAEGVGQVAFWAKANEPAEPAYIILQTSIDGGTNWVNRASFTITTAATRAVWLYVSNTVAMARITFDPSQSFGDVLLDNIEIRLPAVCRNQNFDGWLTRNAYTNDSYQGWFITNCSVGATYAYQGQSARLNTTAGNYIQSPELPEGIGPISFWTRKYLASDPVFTLQIQVSSNGMNWTTLTNISATSTNYQQIGVYLYDTTNHFVRFYHSAGTARVLLDDIRIAAPQPRPEVVITPGFDPAIPVAGVPISLLAEVSPHYGAGVLSVTGYYRIASGPYIGMLMESIGSGFYASLDDVPAQSLGEMIRYYVKVQYFGYGAASDSTGYTTNLFSSAVITNLVDALTFSAITVQGSFIATNEPPPNMMRIGNTPLWESDHHITNNTSVTLRFIANLDGSSWGVTNGTPTMALPAAGTLESGSTNFASVAVVDPGRYRITFNHLTGYFTFSRLYSDDSQGSPENLIKNPGFELTTLPDGGYAVDWFALQSWPKSVADGYAPHSGKWCGAIHGQWFPGWTNSAIFAQDVAVGEGRTYQASAWLSATPDWTADSMQIKIEWMDSASAIAGSDNVMGIPALSGSWVKYTAEGVAPANATKARIVFLCTGAGTAGTMHVDDVEMRALGPTNYYASAYGFSGVNLRLALREIIAVARINDYDSLHDYYIDSDARPDGSVWDMYSDNPGGRPPYVYHFNACEQAGTYRNEGDKYCREHSWPKSWFNSLGPAYSDIFHLYPTDGIVNNNRNNNPFGEVTYPAILALNGSKTGPCSTPGYAGFVFEPLDQYKGDFARTYFYMSTRYYGQDSGWQTNAAVKGAELNPWTLEMLLRWHEDDPVSLKELVRNDAAYGAQSNRNPFIDYPEWVHDIWGYATNRDLPHISIQHPAALLSSIPADSALSIQGQVSSHVVGELVWSNSTTSAAGSLSLTGTNFLLSDIPLAYGQNQVHLSVSNGLGQTVGRSLVVFRQTGARETFDNDSSWIGGLCEKYWDDEFTTLHYVPTNRVATNEEFIGTQVAIKKSMTMDDHGCSWGMNPYSGVAMVRFQTPRIVTNFSVYLANYTTNVPTSFMVLVSTNSGGNYEELLATNNSWFGAAQQFKKYESPPLYAKPQPGMLTYVEIVKTSGEMLLVDDFDCVTSVDPNDLDMDNVLDSWELKYFHNLSTTDGTGDFDQDGLSDQEECFIGTDPRLKDTDRDGQPDGQEYIAGTSGTNELDFFSIKEISPATESLDPLVIYWDTVTGKTYHIYAGPSMFGAWSNAYQVSGDGQRKNFTNQGTGRMGYFRLTVEIP